MSRRPRPERPPSRAHAVFAAALAVFAYALWLRVAGVAHDFWLMQDQVGDWDTVQGSFGSLPLTGPAKTGGGTHLGPAYYWWLWLVRRALAPWTGALPHAMGIAGSLLDAASFALLVPAIASLGVPLVGATASVLLAATVPYEAALARAGWNPCFSLGCLNLALGLLVLWRRRIDLRHAVLVAALAWAAVGSHLSAIVVAGPILLGLVVAAGSLRGRRAAVTTAAGVFAVVATLQVPWFLAQCGFGARAWSPGEARTAAQDTAGVADPGRRQGEPAAPVAGEPVLDDAPTAVTRTVDSVAADPRRLFSPRGIAFVATEAPALLLRSLWLPDWASTSIFAATVALACAGLARGRVDPLVAGLALLPLGGAALAYGAFAGALPGYFLVPLLGTMGLVVALAVGSLPARAARVGSWVLLAIALVGQPHRIEDRRWEHSYRWYGTAVRGAREIVARGIAVRRADGPVEDRLPTSTTALVRWLGGRVDPASATVARIARDGSVTFGEEP